MSKPQFKTSIGGQALMEGVMMRGKDKIACAVRKPDGDIDIIEDKVSSHAWQKIPFVRGALAMIDSMLKGYHYLMHSAEISMGEEFDEEPSKFEKWLSDKFGEKAEKFILGFSAVLGGLLAILLFTVLPTFIVGFITNFFGLNDLVKVILEAIFKVTIFVTYLWACSHMKDIRRVFSYHGAEHKTIACYEANEELTVENVRKHSRFHPRCGTSFLILVVIVSVFLYSALPWDSMALRVVYKVALLPVVMGISYELLKLCGRFDNILTRIIRAPGLWVQRLTVFEPEDEMIEVAIAAITPVLPPKPEDAKW